MLLVVLWFLRYRKTMQILLVECILTKHFAKYTTIKKHKRKEFNALIYYHTPQVSKWMGQEKHWNGWPVVEKGLSSRCNLLLGGGGGGSRGILLRQRANFHWISARAKNVKMLRSAFNPVSSDPTKWSKTLKQFVGNYRRIV